ncbi:hypothetical protein [Pararhodobacter sp.]|uniref:hypothetical protein n=1 Tax=Pararhodobacter sp. TaxID=2127056 RepID=UPI002AFE6F38|nr:hypothetical protein [Pararhodobacter sp.]
MPIYQAAPAADELLDITAGGVSAGGTYLLTIVNRGRAEGRVSVAVTNGVAPAPSSWIEWEALIKAGDVLARHPLPLPAGARVYVRTTTSDVSVTLIGREE